MVDLATRALHGSPIITGDARAKSTAMRVLDKSDDECVPVPMQQLTLQLQVEGRQRVSWPSSRQSPRRRDVHYRSCALWSSVPTPITLRSAQPIARVLRYFASAPSPCRARSCVRARVRLPCQPRSIAALRAPTRRDDCCGSTAKQTRLLLGSAHDTLASDVAARVHLGDALSAGDDEPDGFELVQISAARQHVQAARAARASHASRSAAEASTAAGSARAAGIAEARAG